MKKLFIIGACLLGIFTVSSAYSAGFFGSGRGWGGSSYGFGGGFGFGGYGGGCCGSYGGGECCGEEPCGECYCKYVTYQPCYYCTKRCVQEYVPYTRTCCRYVPRYYQVPRCRYVPEYYCDTVCKPECEYYDVCDYKCCTRTICEPQCQYIPRYYWRHTCQNPCGGCQY